MSRHLQATDTAGGDLDGAYPSPTIDINTLLGDLPGYASVGAATGFTDGTPHWLRMTWKQSDGSTTFYTAADNASMPSSWSTLGTATIGAASTIFDGTALLELGTSFAGATNPTSGKLYYAQLRNNILDDGTGIQFDADLVGKAVGANTFTEGSSNAATVTVNGALAQAGDGRVELSSLTAATHTLSKPSGTVSVDYLRITNSIATGGAGWYAGTHSVDGGGNTGWIFTAPPVATAGSGNFMLMGVG